MKQSQKGFTLIEIAIVLVIIGLLLGGILKGQELINSARVRNLADSTSGIQAAYFGFMDRYRKVPGDWAVSAADDAIGGTINSGGNDNGRLDNSGDWTEPNALWEHLSKAGFISGAYVGPTVQPTTTNNAAPLNPFNAAMVVARSDHYQVASGTPSKRLLLIIGRGTPVDIARELDTKLDDSNPETGNLRSAADPTGPLTGSSDWDSTEAGTCVNTVPTNAIWDVEKDSQDCNAVYLF